MNESNYKNFSFNITGKTDINRELYGYTKATEQLLYQLQAEISKGNTPEIIEKTERYSAMYPGIPQFKNLLTVAYNKKEDFNKAFSINEEILKEFPDYLIALINKSHHFISKNLPDKVPEILDNKFNLKDLYPSRNEFHISEVLALEVLLVRYFAAIGKFDVAKSHIKLLEGVDPIGDDMETAQLFFTYYYKKFQQSKGEGADDDNNGCDDDNDDNNYDDWMNPLEKEYPLSDYLLDNQTFEKPVFHHAIIDELYKADWNIDRKILEEILQIPRETLIKDLELVLNDAIRRYNYFSDDNPENIETNSNFPLHALFLLAELKAVESESVIFDFFTHGEEFLNFWLGDFITEELWQVFYKLFQNDFSSLTSFIKNNRVELFVRSATSNAVSLIGRENSGKRDEVIAWYSGLFDYFIANAGNKKIVNRELVDMLAGDAVDLKALELLPKIKQLFDDEIIETDSFSDSYKDSEKRMKNKNAYIHELKISKDIFDLYDRLENYWNNISDQSNDHGKDDDYQGVRYSEKGPANIFHSGETYTRTQPKVGRNEPCSCGSGKKYKKCCGQ